MKLTETPAGRELYRRFLRALADYGITSDLDRGVLVGFSGGADSTALIYCLAEYRKTHAFPLLAVHVHHGIRGEEADRDLTFCFEVAKNLGVEFSSVRRDVPALAKERGTGIEETAREVRYQAFRDIISGRENVGVIATAHNATDHLETVLFHILRGSGLRGLLGIPARTDCVIRPLIDVSAADIRRALDESGISYVTDSTNLLNDCSRNYIRHMVLPTLSELSALPEVSFRRLSRNLKCDGEYLDSLSDAFLSRFSDGRIPVPELLSAGDAILQRTVCSLAAKTGGRVPEERHIRFIRSHLGSGPFSIDLPGGVRFISDGSFAIVEKSSDPEFSFSGMLVSGEPFFGDGFVMWIRDPSGDVDSSLNVYKFSIMAKFRSDIINGKLEVRSRREGDTYRYGGMSRRVKTLFHDAGISREKRSKIPVLTDDSGILWIPGFGIREGAEATDDSVGTIEVVYASDDPLMFRADRALPNATKKGMVYS